MKAQLNLEEDDLIKIENEVKKDLEEKNQVPLGYIKVKLPSNGRIVGVPDFLYFRDFTAGEVMELSLIEDDTKNLCKILSGMNFENFDVSSLPSEDILVILLTIYGNFISPTIEKEIYLNEELEEGDQEGQLNHPSNKELIDIPIAKIPVTYLGYNDKNECINEKLKIPFTITDTETGDKIKFKITNLQDVHIATEFCKKLYKNEYIKYESIRMDLEKIQKITNLEERETTYNKYIIDNRDKCEEYFLFFQEFSLEVSKIVQALQIVEYNGKLLESLNDKLDIFNKKISSGMWNMYTNFISENSFGVSESISVFSTLLNKVVTRRIPFRFEEFFPDSYQKNNDKYNITFD